MTDNTTPPLVDGLGREFDPAIHETLPDGAPRLTRKGALRRKRGDQGRKAEAQHTTPKKAPSPDAPKNAHALRIVEPRPVVDQSSDTLRGAAGDPVGPVVAADPVEPAPPDAETETESAAAESLGDAWADDGETINAESLRFPDEGNASEGDSAKKSAAWGVIFFCAVLFAGLFLPPSWRPTPSEESGLGVEPPAGRVGSFLNYLRKRLMDKTAMADLKTRFTGAKQAATGQPQAAPVVSDDCFNMRGS